MQPAGKGHSATAAALDQPAAVTEMAKDAVTYRSHGRPMVHMQAPVLLEEVDGLKILRITGIATHTIAATASSSGGSQALLIVGQAIKGTENSYGR